MAHTITVRPARQEDLEEIWSMVGRAVAHMNALGNLQWGEDYPTRAFYAGDIQRGELYAALVDGTLAGVACINANESPEYDPLPWTTRRPAAVIHRMAIDPVFQRMGVGSALFAFAQDWAKARGISAMRIDTYTQNDRMQALIRKMGYTKVGEIHLHGRPLTYPCFEKAL
ncbi:GNAT family N-acetyltransferase [Pseudoflavonifractor phocaeensis]|uniref:GNAT family N-acetyltransferase n=1 Tax=Pseudoflavonifractor phocaeensis TaxID=1870988 RepID=UPI00195E51E3|nr:GNAT family N-acetyltransferase [Pseudoflavonifractor phocaeensis]MBM6927071.1 GNAT family N-acetyltransferase [Pseudoflavonifractor phocaeensis]